MAVYISHQPKDYFFTKLYTGTAATHVITGVGFQPDMDLFKDYSSSDENGWGIADSVMGTEYGCRIDQDPAWTAMTQFIQSYSADGFTIGTQANANGSGYSIVNYNFRAGTTSGLTTNGSTTITPSSYSFSQTQRFSIVKYSGNGVDGAKVAHGLGVAPDYIIVKRTDDSGTWSVFHADAGPGKYLNMNEGDAIQTGTNRWGDVVPDSVNFTIGDSAYVNDGSGTYIAYSFANNNGAVHVGSYVGNGNVDGPFLYTGFRPAFMWVKTAASGWWFVLDNQRLGYNPKNYDIATNTAAATPQGTGNYYNFCANGLKTVHTDPNVNGSGTTYYFIAMAEFPIVSSNDIPTLVR